jgi:hypothetical protein
MGRHLPLCTAYIVRLLKFPHEGLAGPAQVCYKLSYPIQIQTFSG